MPLRAPRRLEGTGEDVGRGLGRLVVTLLEVVRQVVERQALRRGGAPGSSLLLDLAFLVSPDSEADFLAAAGELREHLAPEGLELEVSGPWPPYSFAALHDGDGDNGDGDDGDA